MSTEETRPSLPRFKETRLESAMEDTKNDLEVAEQVLKVRLNELETARQRMEDARTEQIRLRNQYAQLLKAFLEHNKAAQKEVKS